MENAADNIIFYDFKKSGKKVAAETAAATPRPTAKRPSKNTKAYWKDKLAKQRKRQRERCRRSDNFRMRLQHRGERHEFDLGTSEIEEAAELALQKYLEIINQNGNGWSKSHTLSSPVESPQKEWTLGDYLEQFEALCQVEASTKGKYSQSARLVFAEIAGIDFDRSRYAPKGSPRNSWLRAVDSLPLSMLTESSLLAWRNKRVSMANERAAAVLDYEKSVRVKLSAIVTTNTILRCLRSLFSRKKAKSFGCTMPPPVDFRDIDLLKEKYLTYHTVVPAAEILNRAERELKKTNRNAYLLVWIALRAGLRVGEVDSLRWNEVDFRRKVIYLSHTPEHNLKTVDSADRVSLPNDLVSVLQAARKSARGDYVLESDRPAAKRNKRYAYYRAKRDIGLTNEWLRKLGIKEAKPIHSLRKEFGDLMARTYDLESAAAALRNSPEVAKRHYTSKRKSKVPPPLPNRVPDDYFEPN